MLNAWQVAAFLDELGEGMLARRLCDRPVLLYRRGNNALVALEDRCPHRLLPLSAGTRIGDDVQCGYHGMRFGPDGRCVLVPGQESIPAATRSFPIVERYGVAWIWLGEPTVADPALIPDCDWMDHPDWVPSCGYHHMGANYRLVTDNLLDLSHESYIHQTTIGNQQHEAIAGFPVRVTQEADRLVRRTVRCRREKAAMMRVLHLLTPETETSTHYFWAVCRAYYREQPGLTDRLREATRETFNEDKHILELQQRSILECPELGIPNVAIKLDAAPLQGRRLLARLIAREQADPCFVAAPVSFASDGALPFMPGVAA